MLILRIGYISPWRWTLDDFVKVFYSERAAKQRLALKLLLQLLHEKGEFWPQEYFRLCDSYNLNTKVYIKVLKDCRASGVISRPKIGYPYVKSGTFLVYLNSVCNFYRKYLKI